MKKENLVLTISKNQKLIDLTRKGIQKYSKKIVKQFLATKMVRNACFWLENIHYACLKVLFNMGTFVPL